MAAGVAKNACVKTLAGLNMPRMIYGTAWKKERTTELVVKAVRAGFRAVDTACQPKHYSEPLVGEAVKILSEKDNIARDELFLQTKFTPFPGQDPRNVPYDPKAALDEQVRQSFKVSQKNLQTEWVDSLVLHSPLPTHEQTMIVWREFEKLHQTGLVKQLGISNIYDVDRFKQLWQDSYVKPSIIQNRFYADSGFDVELRAFCRENGVIYTSFWTLTANPEALRSQRLLKIAQRVQKTPAQVWFRFVMHLGIVPLTGTCDPKHMAEDLVVRDFELTLAEVQSLAELVGEPDVDELRDQ